MGTQQVQRRGRRPKGDLRKQLEVGLPSQATGPGPSSPFLRLSKTRIHLLLVPRSAPQGRPGRPVLHRSHHPHQAEKDRTRKKPGFDPQDRVCQTQPTPTEPPSWQQTVACDKIYVTGQEGQIDVSTPPSWRLGVLVLRSGGRALLTHDWAS